MKTKNVIVNFQHISAYKALDNIIEQCGLAEVIKSVGEIATEEESTLMGFPIRLTDDPKLNDRGGPTVFGHFNEYGSALRLRPARDTSKGSRKE
ncbi:unnamed protein product [marine sediment metagenome]|uniref:Uncharacterized protein n=1 Tax=marine sediment metagenome TaxID=412755 RepID=X0U606_9ZZZZ